MMNNGKTQMGQAFQEKVFHFSKSLAGHKGQYGLNTQERECSPYPIFLAMESKPINWQSQPMIPKKLKWKYIGRTNAHWVGTLSTEFPPVRFTLERLSGEKYLVKSDLDGIAKTICTGLENAKQQAQELFNAYALSLFELNGNTTLMM